MALDLPAILKGFSLSEAQLQAATARDHDVVVTAGAGTGKTRTLVARFLSLLAAELPLRQIVAVTFTRKAAREMRNRVRQEIGAYLGQPDVDNNARQKWELYYNELDAARIGTIHSLCGEILRSHPAEMGIDPRFSVLDEAQIPLLVQEATEATLAWSIETDELMPLFGFLRERQLQELIATLLGHRLTVKDIVETVEADTILAHWQEQLRRRQAAAVDALTADPHFTAALSDLRQNEANDAGDAAEGQRRLALTVLESLAEESLDARLSGLARLDEINLVGGRRGNWPGGKEQLQQVKAALKSLRTLWRDRPLLQKTLNTQDEALAAVMPLIYRLFDRAQQIYQELKAGRESLDFDDLEAFAIELLENHESIRGRWQNEVQALLVDEFQDTNERQRRLIRLLCPDSGKLFVVGDPKQSIYRFRGADVAVFESEKDRIANQPGFLIELDTSYRAHDELLAAMNHLLRPVLGDDTPDRPPWRAPFAELQPGTRTIGQGYLAPFVEFHFTLGSKDEALPRAASALAARLSQLHIENGPDYGQMAILCRASGSFQFYENALDTAGIPYLTVAGRGFYERPEVRDLLNALQAIADPHDNLALAGLLRSPACGVTDATLYQLARKGDAERSLWATLQEEVARADSADRNGLQAAAALVEELNQRVGRTGVADILKQFLDKTYYRAVLRRASHPRALRNVAKLLADIHTSELVSVSEFLEYAQTLHDSGRREGEARATAGGAVQIMSIHAAKGLEFPVVVLGDASSGGSKRRGLLFEPDLGILLPYKSPDGERATSYQMGVRLDDAQEEAEKARLLYVALTRAEQMLLVSGYVLQNQAGALSWKGWLDQLAAIAGSSEGLLDGYDAQGDSLLSQDQPLGKTSVWTTFYEPGYEPPVWIDRTSLSSTPVAEMTDKRLRQPLVEAGEATAADTPRRIWQVVPTTPRPRAPAWVVGSLVHQALASWRFPDAEFDTWTTARTREFGIVDPRQLRHATTTARRLLQRFQQSPLFAEMNGATRRWHEVPYSFAEAGAVETGRIDALYDYEGDLTVVDFKTDRVPDEAALRQLLAETDYLAQMRRYGQAIIRLLGTRPRLILCLLDYANNVRLISDIAGEGHDSLPSAAHQNV